MMAASSGLCVPCKRPRILLVEDEPLIALEVESILDAAGYEVVGPAATCAQGLALAARHELSCALLDVQLRGECCGRLAEVLADSGVPFVVTSGFAAEYLDDPLLRNAPFLQKPFGVASLLAAVGRMIRREPVTGLAAAE